MKKILGVIVCILFIVVSPFFVNIYIEAIASFIDVDKSDLWNFSGAVLTAVIAGAFIIYQIEFEKIHQEAEFKLQNRADIEFSFVRADTNDQNGYLFGEGFYMDNLENMEKYERLYKAYFDKPRKIPPAYKIECYNKSATKIEIYYKFKSKSGNKYISKINAGNLAEGQTKYFITSAILQHICNPANLVLDKNETLVPDSEYFPDNILDNKIYITFKTLSSEIGIIQYSFNTSKLSNEIKHNRNIVASLEQNFTLLYESDKNTTNNLFNEFDDFTSGIKEMETRLIKLNQRVINKVNSSRD